MEQKAQRDLSRRSLLLAGATALGTSALSYARIIGANDRIQLGHVGVGRRGRELASIVGDLKDSQNVEMSAVCDVWKVNRERAEADTRSEYGRAPRAFANLEDMLAAKDLDAVIISTADHQHAPMLRMAAEAGKDAYCEKPMGNVLEEAKAARDAVRAGGRVVQIGTQHRSERYQIAVKDWISRDVLGRVSKVEVVWNFHGPRWRGRPEVKQIREEETDWRRWLMAKPYRPFDPQLYFEFRLYREFSSGIPDQWMVHAIDLVHYLLGVQFPKSVVAHGGVYVWRDGRENADTFQALLEYPEGFLVSYSTSFGNDSDSSTRIMGEKGTLINIGGEGSQRWKLVEEKGTHESNPFLRRSEKYVKAPGEKFQVTQLPQKLFMGAVEKTYGPLPFSSDKNASHMKNWLACMRTRQQPNANVDAGFAHSVAAIMAARAQVGGRRLVWDGEREEIVAG